MLKKYLSVCLLLFYFLSLCRQVECAEHQEPIRSKILARGTGEKAKIKITLQDNSKISGYIKQSSEESFVLFNGRTKSDQTIEYSDVKNVEKAGLSKTTKILIFTGIGVAVAVIVIAASDPFGGFNIDPTQGL